jgi:hypothetical protein
MHVVINLRHKFLIPQKQRLTMSNQRAVASALHTIIKREIKSARSTPGMPQHIMRLHCTLRLRIDLKPAHGS